MFNVYRTQRDLACFDQAFCRFQISLISYRDNDPCIDVSDFRQESRLGMEAGIGVL
jgi:hypothetical protein